MDWAAVSNFGAKAAATLSEASKLAELKLGEAGKLAEDKLEEAKLRAQPPITVGQYRLVKLKKLADGGFSEVFLARDADGEDLFALKRMVCQTAAAKADAKSELKLLKAFGAHPNLIAVLGASARAMTVPGQRVESMEIHFLFPLYRDGSLFDIMWAALEKKRSGGNGTRSGSQGFGSDGGAWPFPEPFLLQVASGVAKGLKAMHDKGYAHLDMKPHNVMLANDGTPIIMDLGSAAPHRRDIATRQDAHKAEDEASTKCSAPYRCPELTEVRHPAALDFTAADSWSLGCTLFAMAFDAWSPFESEVEGVKRLAILNGKYSFPSQRRNALGCVYSEGFCDLLRSLLNLDPLARPNMGELRRFLAILAKHEPLPPPQPRGSGAASGAGAAAGGENSGKGALKQYLDKQAQSPPSQSIAPPRTAAPAAAAARPPTPPPAAAPAAAPPNLLDFFDDPAPPHSSNNNSSSRGDFAGSAFDTPAFSAPAPAPPPQPPSFDAFGSAPAGGAPTGAAVASDDDFGDFGDFVGASGPSSAPATSSSSSTGGGDFGQFNGFHPAQQQQVPQQPQQPSQAFQQQQPMYSQQSLQYAPNMQQQQQPAMMMGMNPSPQHQQQQPMMSMGMNSSPLASYPLGDPFASAAAPPAAPTAQAPAPAAKKSGGLDALNPFEGL